MALTLVATSNGTRSALPSALDDGQVLNVVEGEVVTLTATSDRPTALGEVTWTFNGIPVTQPTPVDTNDPTSKAIAITAAGLDRLGTYRASTRLSDGSLEESNPVDFDTVAGSDDDEPEGVAGAAKQREAAGPVGEIEVGELNKPFAYVSLLVLGTLAAAIIFIAWRSVSRIALPASTAVAQGTTTFGTWGERTASLVQIVAVAGGLVMILVGAWLAVIETRGKLRIRMHGGAGSETGGPAIDAKTAEAVGAMIGRARRFRGAIAVVTAGVLVVGFALWGASGS